jgi:hypothetical protein
MKRFVCVPSNLVDGDVPEKAKRLAEESQLSIRIVNDVENICIQSFPEVDMVDCMEEVHKGCIHVIDVTNEFVHFTSDTHLQVVDLKFNVQKIKPVLSTKHTLRFRSRFNVEGLHVFCIANNDGVKYYGGEFQVI